MNQSTFQRAAIFIFLVTLTSLAGVNRGYAEAEDNLELAAPVSPRKSIRFYKATKQLQDERVMLTPKKASSPGCQNFLKSVRVHRATQTGYTACLLYTEKDCDDNSIVAVAHEEDPGATYFLTEGMGWMPQSEEPRGVKIGSWNCGLSVEPELHADEAALAATEMKRLKVVAHKSVERAAIAQQKADRAKKNANTIKQRAALARKRAIAAGVLLPEKKFNADEEITEADEEITEDDEASEKDEGPEEEPVN